MIKALTELLGGGKKAPSSAMEARVPERMRVYAVGDIHGRSDLLETLLRRIQEDVRGYKGDILLVFMGDYIDRGPDSAGVVEILTKRLPKRWMTVFLRGNHEQAMLDFLKDPKGRSIWLGWGGTQAVESYGVRLYGARGTRELDALAAELELAIDEMEHRGFYNNTKLKFTLGDYAFVHAGVRPKVDLDSQFDEDLLFIREDFLGRPHGLPWKIVFGHTVFEQPLVQADRVGIDTGAFQSGILTALVLEGTTMRFIQTA